MPIPDSLVKSAAVWLGDEGRRFFRTCLRNSGRIDPVLTEGWPPHPVHFREGMQVRNFLRQQPECAGWDSHDFDNRWVVVVEAAISIDPSETQHEP